MLALPRSIGPRVIAIVDKARPRAIVTAGVIVPFLFVVFACWGMLMTLPAFRALSIGMPPSGQIATLEHGEHSLRPVWSVAPPGLALGLVGLAGAAWAFHQYRLPEPPSPE